MGTLVADCPYCGATLIGLVTIGVSHPAEAAAMAKGRQMKVGCAAMCPACLQISPVDVEPAQAGHMNFNGLKNQAKQWHDHNQSTPEAWKLIATVVRTPDKEPHIPEH